MSHLNTLEIYDAYIRAGVDPITARSMTDILENSFMTKVNDLVKDFASSRVISVFGSIIIIIGGFTLARVWDLSHEMTEVKYRLTIIEEKIK